MAEQWLAAHLGVSADVAAVADVFVRRAGELLREGVGADVAADEAFAFEVRAEPGAHGQVAHLRIVTGTIESHGSRVSMPLRWEPVKPAAFPSFTGSMEFHPITDDVGQLTVLGRYDSTGLQLAPTAAMDALRATARRLLRALATSLGRTVSAGPWPAGSPALRARDLMTPDPLTVRDDTPLQVACLILLREQVGGVPVVDASGTLVGVLSESDLLAREAAPRQRSGVAASHERARRLATTAGEACTRPAVTAGPDMSAREAARVLLDEDVSRLVVVGEGRPIGVLSRHDVLKALARSPVELQDHIDAALDNLGAQGAQAEVLADGTVRLTGQVGDRNSVPVIEHAVWSVDGVSQVRNELTWRPAVVPD